jgi:hypothetical protein
MCSLPARQACTIAGAPGQGALAQFIAASRPVHDPFTRLTVRNVVRVSTTGYLPHSLPHAGTIGPMFPGEACVDGIGYDPCNYYSCRNSRWQSFAKTIGPFYRQLISRHFGSPSC